MPNSDSEKHSIEVQQIIGYVPSRLIRWGISSVFMIFITILVMSWFVKYPDIIKGRALIVAKEAPIELVSRASGNLTLLLKNNMTISDGDLVAYIENDAKLEDVLLIEGIVNSNSDSESHLEYLRLGELQNPFSNLKINRQRYDNFLTMKPQENELKLLSDQILNLSKLNRNLVEQQASFERELEILEEIFVKDSTLFAKKVLSSMDFKEREVSFLKQKRAYTIQKASIINNDYQIKELEKQVNRLKMDETSNKSILAQEFENSQEEMINAIENWKQKYLIISPLDGELSYLDFFDKNQFVLSGKALFAVIPSMKDFYARVSLPVYASGKVKVNQSVNIRLDNYPQEEYGRLIGRVAEIASIPSRNAEEVLFYNLIVELPNGVTTTFSIDLDNKQLLTGEMEVITEDLRVLERIFNWFKGLKK